MKVTIDQTATAKLLDDTGLLGEINRTLLHPLGLALAVQVNKEGETIGFSGMIDYRHDPEGIIFAEDTLKELQEKLRLFLIKEGYPKRMARQEALGYVVQPYPDGDTLR